MSITNEGVVLLPENHWMTSGVPEFFKIKESGGVIVYTTTLENATRYSQQEFAEIFDQNDDAPYNWMPVKIGMTY